MLIKCDKHKDALKFQLSVAMRENCNVHKTEYKCLKIKIIKLNEKIKIYQFKHRILIVIITEKI